MTKKNNKSLSSEPEYDQLFTDDQLGYLIPLTFVGIYAFLILTAYNPWMLPGIVPIFIVITYAFFMKS